MDKWPCKICRLPKSKHIEVGGLFSRMVFHCPRKFQYRGEDGTYLCFTPMENFEYVEWFRKKTKQYKARKKAK